MSPVPSLLPGHPAGPHIFDKADCLGMGFGQVIPRQDVVLEEFLLLRISVSGRPQQCTKVVPETVHWYQWKRWKLLPKIKFHKQWTFRVEKVTHSGAALPGGSMK